MMNKLTSQLKRWATPSTQRLRFTPAVAQKASTRHIPAAVRSHAVSAMQRAPASMHAVVAPIPGLRERSSGVENDAQAAIR